MAESKPMHRAPNRHGELIGARYILGEVLGVGGMGAVYAALQPALQRTVAIKVPHLALLDDLTVRARFQTEARAGARVSHRNIVRVLELGEHRGTPFLVMEQVAGPRLSDLIHGRAPMPVADAARMFGQIVAGVAEAHAADVIHGDLKCDNVLVETRPDGALVPRLIDFGLARFADVAVDLREPRMIAGTPEYLAPELARGDPASLASDVYALGIMLYELLTGAMPFAGGTTAEVMQWHDAAEVQPALLQHPEIPPALEALIECALEKRPAKRFADAGALLDALAHTELPPEAQRAIVRGADRPTRPMRVTPEPVRTRLAAGSTPPASGDSPDEIVVAYLELAEALVETHAYEVAIAELEKGVGLLSPRTAPVWRLQLLLAALYEGRGDRIRACRVTREAKEQTRSAVGRERAARLLDRLLHGRRS